MKPFIVYYNILRMMEGMTHKKAQAKAEDDTVFLEPGEAVAPACRIVPEGNKVQYCSCRIDKRPTHKACRGTGFIVVPEEPK